MSEHSVGNDTAQASGSALASIATSTHFPRTTGQHDGALGCVSQHAARSTRHASSTLQLHSGRSRPWWGHGGGLALVAEKEVHGHRGVPR